MKTFSPLLYPFNLNDSIRKSSGMILYHNGISVSLPSWASPLPIQSFLDFIKHLKAIEHPLSLPFHQIFYSFTLVQSEGMEIIKELVQLEDKINRIILIYPCLPDNYENIQNLNFPIELIDSIKTALKSKDHYSLAAADMIFRVHELMLLNDNNVDVVKVYFENRCNVLESFEMLLVESLINRIILSSNKKTVDTSLFFTTSELAIKILSYLGTGEHNYSEIEEISVESLSFNFFNSLIKNAVPELNKQTAKKISKVLKKNELEIQNLKKRCHFEASNLYLNYNGSRLFEFELKKATLSLEKEAFEIVNLNSDTFKSVIKSITEDPVIWTTFSGAIGSIINNCSETVAASLAITTFSRIGATAVKAKNSKDSFLKESDLSVLYHL